MNNEEAKREMITSSKTKKLTSGVMGQQREERPIFIDEITTQHTRNLLMEARKLREYGVKYVWSSKGDVLIRERDGAGVQRIDSLYQIECKKRELLKSGRQREPLGEIDTINQSNGTYRAVKQKRAEPQPSEPDAKRKSITQRPINQFYLTSNRTNVSGSVSRASEDDTSSQSQQHGSDYLDDSSSDNMQLAEEFNDTDQ